MTVKVFKTADQLNGSSITKARLEAWIEQEIAMFSKLKYVSLPDPTPETRCKPSTSRSKRIACWPWSHSSVVANGSVQRNVAQFF
jgi:hypothetical protein